MIPILVAALACGLPDRGVFTDLDGKVNVQMPPSVEKARTWVRIDNAHHIATLHDGDAPVRAYALSAKADSVETLLAAAREQDRDELRQFVAPTTQIKTGAPPRSEDRDGDGIVDSLDILIGAKKLLHNGAKYIERYVSIAYPNGDVPRSEGVCSDTVIRALRNAGIDLQKEIHEDILRARGSYPMVEKVDASINHRRVKTLLPWFVRHFRTMPKGTPYRPGDVVFFDTFPTKAGPDHLGIVGDRAGSAGLPVVINNWTDGTVDAEMDLLPSIPVTHHFRVKAASTSP
jgi:uncharacterized protein YijF (DUF1287 family)